MKSGYIWLRRFWWLAGWLPAALGADFRVAGSDQLGLEFSQAFYAHSGRAGFRLALAFDGSRAGLEALKGGRADLAVVVLPAEEAGALAGLRARAVGYHRVVVLAPAACPLGQISLEQLALAFGPADPALGGGATRWSELGATGEWGAAPLVALAPETGAGMTAELFRRLALRGRAWKPAVQRYATPGELAGHFGEDSKALALASALPAVAAGLKVLAVAGPARQPAAEPTPENLHAGRYPLSLAVQVVFRPERESALAPLFAFLFGDEAARVLDRAGIAPLPAAARRDAGQAAPPK